MKPLPRSIQDSDASASVHTPSHMELSVYPNRRNFAENIKLEMFTLEDAIDRIHENKMADTTEKHAYRTADKHVEKRIDNTRFKRFEKKTDFKSDLNSSRRIGAQDKFWTLIGTRGEQFKFKKLRDLFNSSNLRRMVE